jgi:hypothetical protein
MKLFIERKKEQSRMLLVRWRQLPRALLSSSRDLTQMVIILCVSTGWKLAWERLVQTGMQNIAWLRRLTIAAVTTGALSWPLSVAHADQQPTRQRWQQPHAAANAWAGTSFEARCTWPYRNQFPPCMSTWPEGDPNYHGSRSGPTFNR